MSKPTWKNTFNSDISPRLWGWVDRAFKAAVAAGYPYISWNGRVYAVNEGNWQLWNGEDVNDWKNPTICLSEELDK